MRNDQLRRTSITHLLFAASPSKATLRAFARLALASTIAFTVVLPAAPQAYKVTNILSDGSVAATTMDANFINPWAVSSTGTWWIAAAGTGYDYAVSATASPAGTPSFKVIVPTEAAPQTANGYPAGSVTTGGAVGMVLPNGTKASFLFSTLDGAIAGWNSKLGTANAITQVVVANAGASYTGLAVLNILTAGVTSSSYILAPNFNSGAIEVYDSTFKATKLAGTFTDPNLPANYAPFGIHIIGTQIFVTYALRSTATPYRTVTGSGNGLVDIFDTNGNFVSRAVTGGNLNAPWGVAIAPANYGIFSSDLLVGNFGDGMINVYDPKTFAFLGQLMDNTGKSLAYASLWELLPGGTTVTGTTAVSGGDTSTVFFTAGLANEAHGLFAGITNAVTAGSVPTFGFSLSAGAATVTAGSSIQTIMSVAPANGYSGTIIFSCAGLPAGATCNFSPAQLSVSPTVPTTGTLTIQTTKASANLHRSRPTTTGIVSALVLPFATILIFRRRLQIHAPNGLRLLGLLMVMISAAGALAGCISGAPATTPVTPAGTSLVTITATGVVSQSTTLTLTVQ
jgi:uncharacterized protein (TIGR03118 family)